MRNSNRTRDRITLDSSKAGLEARKSRNEDKGHGLGAPYTNVAAAFVEALTTEAEGEPKQVLTTFMAHVAARQHAVTVLWSSQGEGGLLSGRNPNSSAQGEGDDVVQPARIDQERGRGRGNAGRSARSKTRETSTRPNAESERSREGSGRRTEDRDGANSGEAAARLADSSAEAIERLRLMARHSVVAARMLANAERNRQLSRVGAAP